MDSEQELTTQSPTREDDDSSEDEIEEDEPALKYERIMGNAPDLFKKDSASALAVCGGVIVGTRSAQFRSKSLLFRLLGLMQDSFISWSMMGSDSNLTSLMRLPF